MKPPKTLEGRTLYVHPMTYAGASCLAAAFRSLGVDAKLPPPSDDVTMDLGGRFTSGEECLPAKVTMGDYLKVAMAEGADPKKLAFTMPTANGPCRFGQYSGLIKKVLAENGLSDALVFSPTSADGYEGFGDNSTTFIRTAWRGMVIGDVLTKALYRTRPYELREGDSDEVYERSLSRMCDLIEEYGAESPGKQMDRFVAGLELCRQEFDNIPADYSEPRPLIGVVGEIFCRHNTFSNDQLIRKLEEYGCEAWLADIAEWVFYTNDEGRRALIDDGKGWWHPDRWKNYIKDKLQRRDEHDIYDAFAGYFRGYEEPESVIDILEYAYPYLPHEGSLGEMVLSTGKSIYLYHKGIDGIIDISPFSCMNGIITEATYTKLSRDYDDLPIRVFYFDGIASELDRDVGIFAELARSYGRRKKTKRVWPHGPIEKPAEVNAVTS